MHIHILGICGTFMGSLAVLAKQLGHKVSGSDANVYPPMSTQLQEQGITLQEGFKPEHLQPRPDLVIIGNALSRGNPAVEAVLNEGLNYTSGPQWLAQYVLQGKWVIGVAGTHGKTSTSAMLTWILEYAGMKPGYLIGGVTNNMPSSASMGDSVFFVVEADEYDSAFFDKRSKFIHYAPRTVVLNNLEYDHADIFDDLEAIKKQFHHLLRTVPGNGLVITPQGEDAIESVIDRGCWTARQQFGISVPDDICKEHAAEGEAFWNISLHGEQGNEFELTKYNRGSQGDTVTRTLISWDMTGIHNVYNCVAAIVAAHHVGVDVTIAAEAIAQYKGVKRRLELRGEVDGVKIYDDFAHHPTAIAATLQGMAAKLKAQESQTRLIAVIEPRSNTMRLGIHQHQLVDACQLADLVVWRQQEGAGLDTDTLVSDSKVPAYTFASSGEIVAFLKEECQAGDSIVVMSNGGFDGIHDKLLEAFASR